MPDKSPFSGIVLPQVKAEAWVFISQLLVFLGMTIQATFPTGRMNFFGLFLQKLGEDIASDNQIKPDEIWDLVGVLFKILIAKG